TVRILERRNARGERISRQRGTAGAEPTAGVVDLNPVKCDLARSVVLVDVVEQLPVVDSVLDHYRNGAHLDRMRPGVASLGVELDCPIRVVALLRRASLQTNEWVEDPGSR